MRGTRSALFDADDDDVTEMAAGEDTFGLENLLKTGYSPALQSGFDSVEVSREAHGAARVARPGGHHIGAIEHLNIGEAGGFKRALPAAEGFRALLLEFGEALAERFRRAVFPTQIMNANPASGVNDACHLSQGTQLVKMADGALRERDVKSVVTERKMMRICPGDLDL
jgi:hypothetical protein